MATKSTFYIKVFDLNGLKHLIFYFCTILPITDFHELLQFSQYSDSITTICNTVRPQHHFTQQMTSEKYCVKRLILNSFDFHTRYQHFYNFKLLYSGYLNQILWYKRYLLFDVSIEGPALDLYQITLTELVIIITSNIHNISHFFTMILFLIS